MLAAVAIAALQSPLLAILQDRMLAAAGSERPTDEADWLVRSTLLTLHDANRTGNYSVLWALASPSLQTVNSPARLAEIFAGVRRTGLDAVAIASSPIDWLKQPQVGHDRILRLGGRLIDAQPEAEFALAFEAVSGVWRLVEINVRLSPPRLAAGR